MSGPTQPLRVLPSMPREPPLASRPPPRYPQRTRAPPHIHTSSSEPWQSGDSNIGAQYQQPFGMEPEERPPPGLFRPDADGPLAPPSSYRYNVPSTYLAQSPGPEQGPSRPMSSRPPSSKYAIGRPKLDPRISQYSASLYSIGDRSPTGSPNVAQMPTFADMQKSLAEKGLHHYAQQSAVLSCYEPENPFADIALPPPPSHQSYLTSYRDSSATTSSSTYSGQFNLYIPEKDGVVSPLSGEAKGIDSIVSPINSDDDLAPVALCNRQPKAFLTPVEEKSEPHYSVVPELSIHPPSTSMQHDSAIASSMALVPEPLNTPKSAKPSSRSDSPQSLHVSNMAGARTPSPRPSDHSFDASTVLNSGSSRARSPLIGTDNPFQSSPTPPAYGGAKLFLPPQRKMSLRDRLAGKQPPDINVDAVKQAQAHGSLTSLPGLINRALNMASNIEQGKTASKQSDWFGNDLMQELTKKGKSTASLGQVLEGFTFSPAVLQHPRDGTGNGFDGASKSSGTNSISEKFNYLHQQTHVPDHRYASDPPQLTNRSRSKYDYRGGPRQRRCCGMPLWIFLLLLAGTISIIVLAIALPLAFFGGKHSKKAEPTDCASSHPCMNRGASVPGPDSTCSCVCTDNFTGSNCGKSNDAASCGSIQTSTITEATVGSNLVTLFNKGESQFLIPLNASIVLPIFSANNLSCDMENALISVGSTKTNNKRAVFVDEFEKGAPTTFTLKPRTTAAPAIPVGEPLHRRQQNNAVTANGILVAGGGSSGSPASSADSASPAATRSGSDDSKSTATASSTKFDAKSADTLAFAKTAIIYTLQASQDLNVAIAAQSALQAFLTSPKSADPKKVHVGGGFVVDFVGWSLSGRLGGAVGKGVSRGG